MRKGDQVLLLLRKNTGYKDGNYSLPAGHLEGGESATDALIRETKEEIGVDLKKEKLEFCYVIHRRSGQLEYIDLFFTIKNWQGTPQNLESEKHGEIKWVPIDKLPENMVPEIKHAIEKFQKKEMYSEFDWD
ncbi:MAG: hypothetical protein A2Z24_02160 [Candidatus Woykebacteria bacterium RBG_16_44_10]|uniref:Nudix hydrolase domain-containing protein n=1 Tax=Candidatus Woykebacteria bacterium RBG_16_44_10 TaxID=1802597 RepID=A0A1G1WG71_9BACT|nr:MAG: hypothetical protein A2Z24_02160 [Candidatus Woykebacteria bacterium RBG_16_44_10]